MPSRIYPELCVTNVSVGDAHSLSIKDGCVFGWGSPAKKKLSFIGRNDIKEVDCGYAHSVALLNNGTAEACGNSSYFNRCSEIIPTLRNCVGVRASRYHTAVMCKNDDGEYEINIFGLQGCYSSLPDSIYSKITPDYGKIKGIVNGSPIFDINDEGAVSFVTDEDTINIVGVDKKTVGKKKANARINFLQSAENICVALDDSGVSHAINWGDRFSPVDVQLLDNKTNFKFLLCGNNWAGGVDSKGKFTMIGEHFGESVIVDGWKIVSIVGGNNGYAMTLMEPISTIAGKFHLVLVGRNTINKEIVIAGHRHSECPRSKELSSDKNSVYVVRKPKSDTVEPISSGSTNSDTVAKNNTYKCNGCNFNFASSTSSICPICDRDANG